MCVLCCCVVVCVDVVLCEEEAEAQEARRRCVCVWNICKDVKLHMSPTFVLRHATP